MTRFLGALFLVLAGLVWLDVPGTQETRPHYITPVYGTGTETDPYHSGCFGMPGFGNIDLRPDIDGFLCASNELPANMTGVQQIGDSFKSALGAKKSGLDAKFKKTLKASTVEELIIEVIEPKLIAGKDGKKKIFLGHGAPVYQQTAWVPFRDNGLVADVTNFAAEMLEPELAWAATISDNFTASDGNLDSCCTSVWTEYAGTDWTIASNQAVASGGGASHSAARNTVNSFSTTNQTLTVTVVALATGTAANGTQISCGPFIRKAPDSTSTYYRTAVQLQDAGELNQTFLYKTVSASTTQLDVDTSNWSANDTATISADGTTISGQRSGGSLMSVTDSSITTGNNYGIRYFSDYTAGATGCTLDTLTGNDIATARPRGGAIWFN